MLTGRTLLASLQFIPRDLNIGSLRAMGFGGCCSRGGWDVRHGFFTFSIVSLFFSLFVCSLPILFLVS